MVRKGLKIAIIFLLFAGVAIQHGAVSAAGAGVSVTLSEEQVRSTIEQVLNGNRNLKVEDTKGTTVSDDNTITTGEETSIGFFGGVAIFLAVCCLCPICSCCLEMCSAGGRGTEDPEAGVRAPPPQPRIRSLRATTTTTTTHNTNTVPQKRSVQITPPPPYAATTATSIV